MPWRLIAAIILCFALAACNLDAVEPSPIYVIQEPENPPPDVPLPQQAVPTNAPQPQVQLVSQVTPQAPASVPMPIPVPDPFDDRLDPVLMLASFYNSINRHEYERSYGYWLSPPNQASLSQFTQGYMETAAVYGLVQLPLREGVAAGSSYAPMKTALISIQNNGSQQIFIGCYVGIRFNSPAGDSPTPDPNWRLYDGRATAAGALNTTVIDQACAGTPYEGDDQTAGEVYDYLGTPVTLLQSYYNAINIHDYTRAYSYWETAPNNASLDQFAQGYANTASVTVYVGLSIHGGAAAGSIYTEIPTLLVAANNDGSHQAFTGCFVMRRSNVPVGDAPTPDPNWHLYNATITPVSDWDASPANPPVYISEEIMAQRCAT